MRNESGFRAVAKYLPMSAHKIRPVADVVRSKNYEQAMAILEAMPQKGAFLLKKVIKSAASNAMDRDAQLDESVLFIKELFVDEGPQQKRLWARSHGKADRLLKRSAHITVVVDRKESSR
ncbi:50S ribosomal protein L22 [Entomospira nematocerorum]|uniref:Large ribosomal subunit protein uL22 n=2 Tax=Entomospira TaxID=2834378 RepID=A0A968GFC6_9SPIO|nr:MULTISPECIES: 50S ribosomal protein L22 [Entomospira]NIZ40249.1 50S ribosomal protein L22 [Entomospira entomophilus]NIZ47245.1 50S ribosomal protein L22 [Entomospira nematocera]WDI34213.1 50S ribosomal protein L22 [Entomospira nematocera]WDI35808.1 50S ribosomal protein L22 [Entomospira entomophilus]